jgi:hypothetical protein
VIIIVGAVAAEAAGDVDARGPGIARRRLQTTLVHVRAERPVFIVAWGTVVSKLAFAIEPPCRFRRGKKISKTQVNPK